MTEKKMFHYHSIDPGELHHSDLIKEWESERLRNGGSFVGAYRIAIWEEVIEDIPRPCGGTMQAVVNEKAYPEAAEALVVPFPEASYEEGRIGIAWGAQADWGDVHHLWAPDNGIREGDESGHICDGKHDIEQAIEDWLNDEDAWEARY